MKVTQITFLLFISLAIGQAQSNLQKALETLTEHPSLKHASVSICLLDESGKQIVGFNPNQSLAPASSLKVVTTATALAVLGPDFQFKTEVQYDGVINEAGILNGNIYLKGFGDPTLGSDQFPGMADLSSITETFRLALQRRGIRKVNGYIIGDGSYFESAANAPTWPWNDLGNYYASGVYGLNIHENFYYLRFKQAPKIGDQPTIAQIDPNIPNLELINELKSADRNSGDNAYIFGGPYQPIRYVRGTIPLGSGLFTIKGSIPNPPLFMAQYFIQKMDEIGMECTKGPTTDQSPSFQRISAEKKTLSRHLSPTLDQIVHRANQKSINLYCEAMLKTIGQKLSNEGTTRAGIESIQSYWTSKGMDFAGCFLEDGSGLSPRNSISSYFLANFLLQVKKDTKLAAVFEPSLPVAGQSGTLQSFLRGSAAAGKIKAKSGSFNRVRAYAGYAQSKNQGTISFAIIINNYIGSNAAIRKLIGNFMVDMCR